jgi:nitroimidazol reductase NimA-like FMN-containing flavoprotein (pyridoxamine 5'-phosphate oxidase superfamily)
MGVSEGKGLEEIPEEECWQLVRERSIGRIAVNRDGMGPLVVPVNYAVGSGPTIVFRSGEGTKLDATSRGMLSLQIDVVDPLHRVGWSVLLEGTAEWVRDPTAAASADTWAPGDLAYEVRVHPHRITGRRIRLHQSDTDGRGYR